MHRNGTAEPIGSIPAGTYEDLRLSPDGSRVLATRDDDIWAYELASGRSSRVTRDGSSRMGVWNPTGSQVAYSSAKGGNLEAWITSSDGSGQPRQLTTLGGQVHVDSWSPDGRTLTLHHHRLERPCRFSCCPWIALGSKPEVFLEGDFNAEGANFCARWALRRVSVAGKRSARDLHSASPGTGGQVTVSVGGGREPMWAKNGELFYRNLSGDRMFAVPVAIEPTLKVGTPVQLFQGPFYTPGSGSPRPQYDVAANGQRLLMLDDPFEHGLVAGSSSDRDRPGLVRGVETAGRRNERQPRKRMRGAIDISRRLLTPVLSPWPRRHRTSLLIAARRRRRATTGRADANRRLDRAVRRQHRLRDEREGPERPVLAVRVIEEFKARPGMSGIPFLGPWIDCLDEQAFFANGRRRAFDMQLGNVRGDMPSHGLVTTTDQWNVVEAKADTDSAWVTSRLEFYRQPMWMKQWPFAHTIEITHRLHDGVLEVETAIVNMSAEPMPIAIGFHPYFS